MISEKQLAHILMDLIDGFIGLQLRAKNLKPEERYEFIVKHFRKICADDFEYYIKSHPNYLHQIINKESGPYAETAFDINHQPNLLNL